MSNKNDKVAKQYTATMENALACIGGVKGLAIPDTFTVAYKDKTGASHLKTLTDANEVALYYSIDKFADMGGKVDMALVHLLGEMYQTNAFKVLGFDSPAEYGANVKHIAKSTTNSYINIFRTCFDKNHAPKIAGLQDFGKGQLLSLVALLKDLPTIGGIEFTFTTIEKLIENGNISAEMTVEELNGIVKVLKAFCVPSEWVDVVMEDDGEHYLLKATGEEFANDPRPVEVPKEKKSKKDKQEDADNDVDTIKPIDLIIKALEVYEKSELSEENRTALKDAKNNLLLVLARIDNGN